MAILEKLQAQIAAFSEFQKNKGRVVAELLAQREDELLERQMDQLASGQDSEGRNLTPSYSADLKPGGYFKTSSAARRYADWKKSIATPAFYQQFPRNADTPNLYVNGRFWNEMGVTISENIIEFHGDTAYAEGIINKYGLEKFGLNETFWRMVVEGGLDDELADYLRSQLETI